MNNLENLLLSIKLFFLGAAVVLMVRYMVIPMWRNLRTPPEGLDFLRGFSTMESEDGFEELEIPLGEEDKPSKSKMLDAARTDPQRTAAMVSRWLKQKK